MWAQRVRDALKPLPELTGIEDELVSSQQITLEVDREAARQLGIEMATVTQALNNAFGQRQVSTIYNAMNQYRVVMEVAPRFAQGPESLDQVYVVTATGPRALVGVQPLHTDDGQRPHQPQRPVRLESMAFELAPGVSLSQAETAINRAVSLLTMPLSMQGRLQGNASLFRACRATSRRHPRHAADRLHRARRALRELRPPADHPLDAAVGRCRRADRAAAAQDRIQPRRAAGGVPADRRRDEERHPDDRRRPAARA